MGVAISYRDTLGGAGVDCIRASIVLDGTGTLDSSSLIHECVSVNREGTGSVPGILNGRGRNAGEGTPCVTSRGLRCCCCLGLSLRSLGNIAGVEVAALLASVSAPALCLSEAKVATRSSSAISGLVTDITCITSVASSVTSVASSVGSIIGTTSTTSTTVALVTLLVVTLVTLLIVTLIALLVVTLVTLLVVTLIALLVVTLVAALVALVALIALVALVALVELVAATLVALVALVLIILITLVSLVAVVIVVVIVIVVAVAAIVTAAAVVVVATTIADREIAAVLLRTTLSDRHQNRLMVRRASHGADAVVTLGQAAGHVGGEKALSVASIVDALEENELGGVKGLGGVVGSAGILDGDVSMANDSAGAIEVLRSRVIGAGRVGERTQNHVGNIDLDSECLLGGKNVIVLREQNDGRYHIVCRGDLAHGWFKLAAEPASCYH